MLFVQISLHGPFRGVSILTHQLLTVKSPKAARLARQVCAWPEPDLEGVAGSAKARQAVCR